MQGQIFAYPVSIPGVMAADYSFTVKGDNPLALVRITAHCAADTSCIFNVGTSTDADAYVANKTLTGGSLAVYEVDDFVDAVNQPYASEYVVTIDYDGGAGTACGDLHFVLWLSE